MVIEPLSGPRHVCSNSQPGFVGMEFFVDACVGVAANFAKDSGLVLSYGASDLSRRALK
jgi:hypothetical protein